MHNSIQAATRVWTDALFIHWHMYWLQISAHMMIWREALMGAVHRQWRDLYFFYGHRISIRPKQFALCPPPPKHPAEAPPARPQDWASFAWQNSILSTLYLPRSLLWCVVIALVWRWCAGWEGLGMGMGMRGGGVAEKSVLQWKCAPTEA